jgi:outer membrane protein TolC
MRRSLAFAFLLLATRVSAAPLTWDEAAAEAEKNNPDLLAARLSVDQAEIRYRSSVSAFFPTLTPSLSASHSNFDTETDAGTVHSEGDSVSATLGVSENIFNGFADAAALRVSQANVRAALAAEEVTRAQVSFELRRAFNNLLFAQEQVRLTQRIAERRSENARLVALRFDGGRENQGSVLRSEALEHQATYDQNRARREQRVAQRTLASLIGRDPFETIESTGALTANATGADPDFKSLAENHPSFRRAAAAADAADANVRVARGDVMPDLDATASYQRQGNSIAVDQERGWNAGLRLSLPFPLGGRTVNGIRDARTQAGIRRAELASERNALAVSLESAFANYQDAVERVDVQAQFLRAEEVRAEIGRQQYASGLITFQDWDLIENDLISGETDRLASLRDAATNEAAWRQSQGLSLFAASAAR